MAIVAATVGTKGGTGKTSLTRNFGIIKAKEGKRVLLIDLCQNSDIATRLGYDRNAFPYGTHNWVNDEIPFEQVVQHDKDTGVDFLPANAHIDKIIDHAEENRTLNREWVLKEKLEEIKDKYDYIIFDNHPTETNRMMIYSLVASDIALVPTNMDISSVIATIRTMQIIKSLQKDIDLTYTVVPMAVDFSKGFAKDLQEIKDELKGLEITQFTSAIRYSAAIPRAGLKGIVMDTDNEYYQKVMGDYKVIAEEIDGFAKEKVKQ